MRFTLMQICPVCEYARRSASGTALSRSASSQTTNGALPPSSSVTALSCRAACSAIHSPVAVEPVNAILRLIGFVTISAPTVRPGPVTTFSTPGGMPASTNDLHE